MRWDLPQYTTRIDCTISDRTVPTRWYVKLERFTVYAFGGSNMLDKRHEITPLIALIEEHCLVML